jgi:hypothetical protein
MITTLDRKTEKRLARPLKVLVPIIKADLQAMKAAADEASQPYQIKIGSELIEARVHFETSLSFDRWCRKTIGITGDTARHWIRGACDVDNGVKFESVQKTIYRDDRTDHSYGQRWKQPVRELVDRARVTAEQFALRQLSQKKERDSERKLALRLIDIGYKILSVELHPDKSGGSHEAMQRLNAVRARLRNAA